MDNVLIVSGENGIKYNVKVIDIFHVEEYPNKEYIAYTFEENVDKEHFKAYISILKENAADFTLLGISDKEEWNKVQERFNETVTMLLNNDEIQ